MNATRTWSEDEESAERRAVVRRASAWSPYDITVAFLVSDMPEPDRSTAHTLVRRSPPPRPSVVDEANSSCSLEILRNKRLCQGLLRPWRIRIATIIWCIAKIIAVEEQPRARM